MSHSAPPSDPAHAPRPLSLVQDFLNSRRAQQGVDELADPVAAPRWLAGIGLAVDRIGAPQPMTSDELLGLVTFRDALRELVFTGNAAVHRTRAARHLIEVTRATRFVISTNPDGRLSFEPIGTRVVRLVGTVLAVVHDAQREGTWDRLKICRNEECGWVFYDYSRNNSSLWCAMDVCGNRRQAGHHQDRGFTLNTPDRLV